MIVTPDTIANEVILLRQTSDDGLLIVEGESDEKLFSKFVSSSSILIIPAWGKENAIGAIKILDQINIVKVLTIVDADFWNLDNIILPSINLITTEVHDIEITIIKSKGFDNYSSEYFSRLKIQKIIESKSKMSLVEYFLSRLAPIGYLRRYSEVNSYNFKFEGIDFKKFVSKENLTIDIKKLISIVLANTKNPRFKIDAILKSYQSFCKQNSAIDLFQLCCGHDFVELLSIGLRKALSSQTESQCECIQIEKNLRLAFESKHFIDTELYQKTKTWEQNNKIQIFI